MQWFYCQPRCHGNALPVLSQMSVTHPQPLQSLQDVSSIGILIYIRLSAATEEKSHLLRVDTMIPSHSRSQTTSLKSPTADISVTPLTSLASPSSSAKHAAGTAHAQTHTGAAHVQTGLSPIASVSSGTSHLPKSSSSTGPLCGQSVIDYEIRRHTSPGGGITCLADIDQRLEAINT